MALNIGICFSVFCAKFLLNDVSQLGKPLTINTGGIISQKAMVIMINPPTNHSYNDILVCLYKELGCLQYRQFLATGEISLLHALQATILIIFAGLLDKHFKTKKKEKSQ